jgi:hypothetical protein
MAYDMKLSTTKKTICVRPQVNMATVVGRMKDTQNLPSQLENGSIVQIGTGTVQMWSSP